MTNKDGSVLSTIRCEFSLKINEPIPKDSEFLINYTQCDIHEADSIVVMGHSDGSCYADVTIDFKTKTMIIHLTHVAGLQSLVSPYDDMFGIGNGIRSVLQYKVAANLKHETVQFITRIQCKTFDNCALDKLRYLLSNLTNAHTRLEIFKDAIKLLRKSDSTVPNLSCFGDDEDVECINDDDYCIFDYSKETMQNSGCRSYDPSAEYDLEYRFNVIEEKEPDGFDNTNSAFKFNYLCNIDLCNSNAIATKVDYLLYLFAMGAKKGAPYIHRGMSSAKPMGPVHVNSVKPKPASHAKSNGISFTIGINYRLLFIIFCIFIGILAK